MRGRNSLSATDDPTGWRLTTFDVREPTHHEARFLRWVSIGERHNSCAEVAIEPPLPDGLSSAILAPRHEGGDLREPQEWPIHVYVADQDAATTDGVIVPTDSLTIAWWATLDSPL